MVKYYYFLVAFIFRIKNGTYRFYILFKKFSVINDNLKFIKSDHSICIFKEFFRNIGTIVFRHILFGSITLKSKNSKAKKQSGVEYKETEKVGNCNNHG